MKTEDRGLRIDDSLKKAGKGKGHPERWTPSAEGSVQRPRSFQCGVRNLAAADVQCRRDRHLSGRPSPRSNAKGKRRRSALLLPGMGSRCVGRGWRRILHNRIAAAVWGWLFTDFHLFPHNSTWFRAFLNKNIFWSANVWWPGAGWKNPKKG